MKEDFLTIPDAPGYEINSELIMRNKKTGHLLTLLPRTKKTPERYILFVNGKQVGRGAETWRRQAVAAKQASHFEPVPGYGDRYEVSPSGIVRNRLTKRKLKLQPDGCYRLWDGKTNKDRSKTSLIYEVYDVDKRKCSPAVPVILSKGNFRQYFETLTAAAKFLAPLVYLTFGGVRRYLKQRQREIYGYKITYVEDIQDDYQRELNGLARWQRRAVI